MATGEHMT